MADEEDLWIKNRLVEIESRCLNEELEFIMQRTKTNKEQAYNLLMRYRNIWEFAGNVSTSGDSLIITIPKKEAKERGIKKGTPIFIALKILRFFRPKDHEKMI